MLAATRGDARVTRALLLGGANPTLKNARKISALRMAVVSDHDECSEMLRRSQPKYTLRCTQSVETRV